MDSSIKFEIIQFEIDVIEKIKLLAAMNRNNFLPVFHCMFA